MADYSQTLHLPKTDFPMRGNLPKREPEMQKWWDEIKIYQKVLDKRKGQPKFVLHDGPPYANGDIHIGHALNKTIKDFIVRYKSMKGYYAPYVPGWDTHGLPIEHAIITKKKLDRKNIDPIEFREMCKEYAWSFIRKQRDQFKRLGVRGDWENPYVTLLPEYEAEQVRVFGEMMKKGHIYRGLKTVYWSPSSETALAEAEIEYKDKRSPSIYVLFPVQKGNNVLSAENTYVVIWTTTPWTIPANLGISLNEEFDYSVVKVGDRKLMMASALVEEVLQNIEVTDYQVVQTMKGKELAGVVCRHPFYDRESRIVFGDHVTLDAGTGCVHTAPGHGDVDFLVGQKYGLGVLSPVDEKGRMTKEAPGFEGLYYEDANKKVTEKLEEVGCLLKLTFITHQYPHDWRTKKPVIFRATEQWFASIEGFRKEMLEEVKNVKWTPSWGEIRMHNMIAERSDWCISRQRVWGVPIPIFYCTECGHEHVTEETIDFIAKLFAKEGSSVWYAKEAEELMPPNQTCSKCGGNHFRKETDTMDVWFDSGSSHMAVLRQREELVWPADLYLEGSDQYRGWFNSSLSTSVAITGKAPYKGVLSHGFTLDGEGRKMSKSLGNVVDPAKVINQYGADILRLWVASSDYQSDIRLSDAILKQIAEAYRKLRNTFRFLLGNLNGFDPNQDQLAWNDMQEIDRYALVKLNRVVDRVNHAYDEYNFHQAYVEVFQYCNVFLSQFYLDVLKDRLYVLSKDSPIRRSAQTALYEILLALVKMMAPIIPHTTDEVWKYIPGVVEISVQLADFPVARPAYADLELEHKWDQLLEVRDRVLKALEEARAQKLIGNSLGASVELTPCLQTAEVLRTVKEDLEQVFIVSQVYVKEPSKEVPEAQKVVVMVRQAEGEKCERCWNHSPTVGTHEEHSTLCDRCFSIVQELDSQMVQEP